MNVNVAVRSDVAAAVVRSPLMRPGLLLLFLSCAAMADFGVDVPSMLYDISVQQRFMAQVNEMNLALHARKRTLSKPTS